MADQGLTRRTAPTSPPPQDHTQTASEPGTDRSATEAHALFGPPHEIIAELQALQAVGVRYVLIGGGEGTQSMRRFAAEVMQPFPTNSYDCCIRLRP